MAQTEIEEILNSIKSEYASNTKDFENILTGINGRLDTIVEEGASSDVIKEYLQELKTELETRHHFAVEKFEDISGAFQSLNQNISENQDLLTKSSDMKILFDVLTENINSFANQIAQQKTILDDVDQKIVDFSADNSRKEEIIDNIGVIKEALETFSRGFEASIMDINSNLRSIAKNLMTMDVTDQNDIIKRELENIYLASNAILSTLTILDQKNDDFARKADSLTTKEEFAFFAGKIGETLGELTDKMNLLPLKSEIPDVSFDLARIIDDIQTVKTDLRIANEKEINYEQIEEKINSIYEAFQSALANLSEDKQQVLFSLKDEISQIALGIDAMKNLSHENSFEKINDIELKIEEVSAGVKELQYEFHQKSAESLEQVLVAIEQNREDLSGFNENISEGLRSYLTSITELFASLEGELKSQKADLMLNSDAAAKEKIDNFEKLFEGIKTLDLDLAAKEDSYKLFVQGVIKDLQEGVTDFKAYINSAHLNLENKISEKLLILENVLSQGIKIFDSNLLNFTGKLNECLQTIKKFSTETDIKFGNSVSELADIKSEMTQIFENFAVVREYIEDAKKDNGHGIEELSVLAGNIKSLEFEFLKNADAFKYGINGQLASLSDYIVSIKNHLDSAGSESEAQIAEKLLVLEGKLSEAAASYDEKLGSLQDKISDYAQAIERINVETDNKLESSLFEIASLKCELTSISEKLDSDDFNKGNDFGDVFGALLCKLDEMSLNIQSVKEDGHVDLKDAFNANLSSIEQGFNNIKELVENDNFETSDRLNGLSAGINEEFNSIKQVIGLVNTDVIDTLNSKADAVLEEFVPLKNAISSFAEMDFTKLIEEIKSQIEISYLNFSSDVRENIDENHDSFVHLEESYKTLVAQFERVESVVNDLNINQMSIVSLTIAEIEKNVSINLEKTNILLEEWKKDFARLETKIEINGLNSAKVIEDLLSKIEALIESKSSMNADEIKECISVMVNNEDVLYSLGTFNSELTERLNIFTEDLNAGNKQTNEILNELRTFFKELFDENSKFSDAVDAINEKVDLIALSNPEKQISEVSVQIDDVGFKVSEIEYNIKNLHDKVDVLAFSESDEKIEAVDEKVQALHDKMDVLALSNADEKIEVVEEMVQALHDKVDVVVLSNTDEKLEEMIQALHEKVDVIALSDESEIYDEIQDIKDLIFDQRKQIENLDNNERATRIDKCLEELLLYISKIEKVATGSDLEKSAVDIKDSVMTAILSVTDQISFAQETEEIKGFVEERTEEINKNLLDVKKQLSDIACNSESWDYSYTMQDIESDIAKLRLVLNDISSSSSKDEIGEISNNIYRLASSVENMQSTLTQEQTLGLKNDFEKLNEDIVSISSRTNKLLLTSDESYRALTGGLDAFSGVINNLESRINSFDNSAINERLEKKLDGINSMVTSSANSDKVMKQVMMYLGEWIDGASEKLDNIVDDTADLHTISYALGQVRELLPERGELINILEKKFEEQQTRIDRLEQKLEKVLDAIEEKDNVDLEKKIDRIEKQLNKLGSGIEKLASYVDEE